MLNFFSSRRVSILFCVMLLLLGLPCSSAQTFANTGGLALPVIYHTATLLTDGTVLIAGGSNGTGATATAEIYDPSTGIYSPTLGNMHVARYCATATLLPNGQVLVAGGGAVSAELYNPTTRTFTLASGSMSTNRYRATATLLQNGRVLITGGDTGNFAGLKTAELYFPTTQTFGLVPTQMSTVRTNHTATLLPNGNVLIAGGQGNVSGQTVWNTAEVYNAVTETITVVGNMTAARYSHTATLLPNGTVLIAGGHINQADTTTATAEIYTPSSQTFSATGSMSKSRYEHTATLLADGTVLIAGGTSFSALLNSAEIYSQSSRTFTTTGNLQTPTEDQTATLLNTGKVLLSGGDEGSGSSGINYLSTSELYTYPFTSGNIMPKYVVLGVLYSPPGAGSSNAGGSSVSYAQTTAIGTSASLTDTTGTSTSISTSFGLTRNISQILGLKDFPLSVTASQTGTLTWSQQASSSGTYAVNAMQSAGIGISGPLSAQIGVDHDYDEVIVWLNPLVNMSVGAVTTNLLWNGYSYNANDVYSPDGPDIVYLSLFCLKDPFVYPCNEQNLVQRLSRSWDTTSGLGGLTLDDFATIAQRDPFAPRGTIAIAYNPVTAGDNRFSDTGQPIDYAPVPPADGTIPTTGSWTYQAVSTAGQSGTDSYQVSFATDVDIASSINADFKNSTTTTWTNQWSDLQTFTDGQQAQYAIYAPLTTAGYTGPTNYEVFRDNVYGTFMFYAPGSTPTSPGSIGVSPTSITFGTVAPGSRSSSTPITLTNNSSMPMYMGVSSAFPFNVSGVTALSPVAAFSEKSFVVVSGSDTCTGNTLAAGATCSLSIQFAPSSSDPIESGGLISGTMYFTGETDAAVLATGNISGTVSAASGAAATPDIIETCTQVTTVPQEPGTIQMSDTTTGARIYYTTNGSTPNTSSNLYSGPITITQETTFKAIAVASGYTNSAIVTEAFPPPPNCGTRRPPL